MLDKKVYANGQRAYVLEEDRLTYFYKNGKVRAEGAFVNNQMEGEWRFYREMGQLWQVGHFKNAKKNGVWIRYDRNDQPEYQETFLDDKPVKKPAQSR